ncbi:MAG TPA: fused response regulator/thioredoxin-disulfide reductase [Anaerolineae bacterium]|nr:fused response regulator/thioredoxin-disulfide reductase [Anaerolineae bacterium]
MAKPVIFSLDDDPSVLNSVERDLRARYGQEYRILPVNAGKTALEYLKKMEQRNETVALFLVDQRMPEMSGTDFLGEAIKIYPQAKRVLLTAYADTEAAIDSINEIRLDYYLMKPWHPPDERLYPVLDELLEDWKVRVHLPYDGIRIAGALWSAESHAVKEFLTRHQIPYQWLDVDLDGNALSKVEAVSQNEMNLPVVFFPDGKHLIQPDLKSLAEMVGLKTKAELPFYDLIVLGSGPAGLATAVYAGSEGLSTLVLEKRAPGGQAGSSPKIENYLGFPAGISGDDLTRRAVTQARKFGVEILSAQSAVKVSVRDSYRIVKLEDGSEISAHAVLIATGAFFQTLKMPGADPLTGAGVYYGAAYTEAMNFKDKHVLVVGGANSAAQGALYLARFANKVTMLVRGHGLTSSQYLIEALKANPKIDLLLNSDLVEVHGDGKFDHLVIRNTSTNENQTLHGEALFVFIGVKPQSQMVEGLVALDRKNQILTGPDLPRENGRVKGWTLERDPYLLETNVPGIFAAGDVRNGSGHRVASAVGEGAIAQALIKQYLKTL